MDRINARPDRWEIHSVGRPAFIMDAGRWTLDAVGRRAWCLVVVGGERGKGKKGIGGGKGVRNWGKLPGHISFISPFPHPLLSPPIPLPHPHFQRKPTHDEVWFGMAYQGACFRRWTYPCK